MTEAAEMSEVSQIPEAAAAGAPEAAAPPQAPEQAVEAQPDELAPYTPFTAPDGQALDEQVMGRFGELAQGLKLSQDDAQKLVSEMAPLMAQRQREQIEAQQAQWLEAAQADPEFGGARLQENLAHARRALEVFGTPQLRRLLGESRLGNHPELVRWACRVGRAIGGDGYVNGSNRPGPSAHDPRSFYPNSNHA